MKIETTFVYPPIPYRGSDWCAYDGDTYCGCEDCHPVVGWGATEADAIADFLAQMEDAA